MLPTESRRFQRFSESTNQLLSLEMEVGFRAPTAKVASLSVRCLVANSILAPRTLQASLVSCAARKPRKKPGTGQRSADQMNDGIFRDTFAGTAGLKAIRLAQSDLATIAEMRTLPAAGETRSGVVYQTRPLPSVLIIHTGGTLGMQTTAFDSPVQLQSGLQGAVVFKSGTGGDYTKTLQPGKLLLNLVTAVPELQAFANLQVQVLMNKDSCQIGPKEWIRMAQELHARRDEFDAFVIVHGTDTMAYTASALSLMLSGFAKPIVITGSQLPLCMPRSDARQNLIDAVTCATAGFSPPHIQLEEVAICFGGVLLRGNRARKTSATIYSAFDSPTHPPLARLGVGVEWKRDALLQFEGAGGMAYRKSAYTPRLTLNSNVIRLPIVPGCDPKKTYGDLYMRGVRGIVLEAFGVGNMPWTKATGWIPWLRSQRKQGMLIYMTSQCESGKLHPELYRTGSLALELGAESGPMMTPECAVVKLMLCLAHPNLPPSQPIAGEL